MCHLLILTPTLPGYWEQNSEAPAELVSPKLLIRRP
jgi:hypothetical protein